MELPESVWMDGDLVPTAEAVITAWTHALHYGPASSRARS